MTDADLDRIATALEQIALELKDQTDRIMPALVALGASRTAQDATYTVSAGKDAATVAAPAAPAPVRTADQQPHAPFPALGWHCPVHGKQKIVPAGISKKTGQPYAAFVACGEPGCNQTEARSRAAVGNRGT